jgi:hypothetical protein
MPTPNRQKLASASLYSSSVLFSYKFPSPPFPTCKRIRPPSRIPIQRALHIQLSGCALIANPVLLVDESAARSHINVKAA